MRWNTAIPLMRSILIKVIAVVFAVACGGYAVEGATLSEWQRGGSSFDFRLECEHNATYLTAYAHNRDILVKEGQAVTRGQKIAEMGSTDADRVKLHFEIRRLGTPMDPLRFLPPA